AEGGIRDDLVTGVQTCALPISQPSRGRSIVWTSTGSARATDWLSARRPGARQKGAQTRPPGPYALRALDARRDHRHRNPAVVCRSEERRVGKAPSAWCSEDAEK